MGKKDKKRLNKKQKLSIILTSIFSVLVVSIISAYFIVGNYAFGFALNATVAATSKSPVEVAEDLSDFEIQYPNTNKKWFETVKITPKTIKSKDGYKLIGYQILAEEKSDLWVITVHGYRGSAIENGLYAQQFHEKGFNVLLPDLEGHGLSEGKYIGMGYDDRFDIMKWIDLIISENPNAKIVLHGVSMGASTVLLTTGEKLPSNVKVAISDCAYTNVKEEFLYLVDEYLELNFKNFIMSGANTMCKIKLGISFDQINVTKAVQKSTTPTLFIHGDQDKFVPFYMLDKLYRANENLIKDKLVVEGAHHAMSSTINTELYFQKVFEFINNNMN